MTLTKKPDWLIISAYKAIGDNTGYVGTDDRSLEEKAELRRKIKMVSRKLKNAKSDNKPAWMIALKM